MSRLFIYLALTASLFVSRAAADDAAEFGALRTYATIHSLGVEWDLAGDDDHDATCAVDYRAAGTTEWREAFPLLRVDYQWSFAGRKAATKTNRLAGSVLFLEPGTRYEVRLKARDPDGGEVEKIVEVTTRPVPTIAADAPVRHVMPAADDANTDGDGSRDNPFRGLAAAQKAAQPGDVFLLHAGRYGRATLDRSGAPGRYVAWKSAGDGDVVFEQVLVAADHVWLEGLTFRRAVEPIGLRARGPTTYCVVLGNRFEGFHHSVVLDGRSAAWYVADNVIVGDNDPLLKPPAAFDGEGIELSDSSGHTVCHNDISRVSDGCSYPGTNVDIFGNDVHDVSDDAVELDHGRANVRVWGNRLTGFQFSGVSFQPMYDAPWYLVRNQFVGRGEPFKFYGQDRFVCVNNTFVVWRGQSWMQNILRSTSRNNLYVSFGAGRTLWDARPLADVPGETFRPDWRTDVDYDGFAWDGSAGAFRWNGQSFDDIASFAGAVGIERHGVALRTKDLFDDFVPPASPAEFTKRSLLLRAGTAAIDAGIAVPNLSDAFTGTAPDLGAHEHGGPPMTYGPRVKK
jgi:hypothetical protein